MSYNFINVLKYEWVSCWFISSSMVQICHSNISIWLQIYTKEIRVSILQKVNMESQGCFDLDITTKRRLKLDLGSRIYYHFFCTAVVRGILRDGLSLY